MRSFPLVIAAALLVLLAGCGDSTRNPSGQVTASASVDAFSIKVGDCTGDLGSGSVTSATLVPCAESHYWEAYASTELSGDDYPGITQVQEKADATCTSAFKDFVGVSTDKSDYDYTYFYPTEQTWTTADDREVLCFAGSDDGGITGTLKDAKK